jgi:threonine dehydrogenase-like Zn-dependent dehydrogenase
MKALVVEGEWRPRQGYPLTEEERAHRKAFCGSQVWRQPHFAIKEVPTPRPKDDEVLIRVMACGICGSDSHLYETDEEGYIIFSGLVKLPCILGHEFSGIIEDLGEKVTNLVVGDLVAVESIQWCGLCTSCRSGAPNQCKHIELLGLSSHGAFAEFIAINEKYCWKINSFRERYTPAETFEIGALIEPIGCGYNGIFISGEGFRPGETMAVYGLGPIGLASIALAKIAGASKIIAFDRLEERLALAKALGADFAFNVDGLRSENSGPGSKVLELTHGEGADIQVEAAGDAPATIPEMEKSTAPNGRIIYLGRAQRSTPMFLDALVSGANKIVGARGHAGYGIFPNIIRLISSGRLEVREMITARYPFDQVIEAIQRSTQRTDGKIIINMT